MSLANYEYFANSYGRAFDELTEIAIRDWPNKTNLSEAIFFLCRHSIELSIKSAILNCSEPALPNITGHNWLELWKRLQEIMATLGL